MVVARAERGIKYATSSGMASAKRVKTVPTSMSKIPQDLVPPPKRKGKGKGGSRSGSPNRKSKEEMAKIPCTYFQQGKCRRGDKCFYKHEVAAAPTKDPKRTNSPAPKKKASAKAAPCITQRYACIAKGKGLPKATKAMKEQCHRAIVFSSKVEYIKVPATGEQRKVVHKPRIYEKDVP